MSIKHHDLDWIVNKPSKQKPAGGSGSQGNASSSNSQNSKNSGGANASQSSEPDPNEEPPKQPPPPEIQLIEAEFKAPDGFGPNKNCKVEGKGKLLKDTSKTKLELGLSTIYGDKEVDQQLFATTNIKKDGTFTFTGVTMYIPDDYPDHEAFSKEIRYKGCITGANVEKELEFFIDLPLDEEPAKPISIKKDMYDDKAVEKYPSKYQKDGEGYVAGTPVFEFQQAMEQFRYLPSKTANGVFGPKTDKAARAFQKDSQSKLRVLQSSGKLGEATIVTFKSSVDGIVGQKTRDEIEVWKAKNFLRPLPTLYKDDFDRQAINSRKKSDDRPSVRQWGDRPEEDAKQDDYHDIGNPVLDAQKDLESVGAYDGDLDGWFFDKMKDAVELFQEYAAKGQFLINDVLTDIGEKLTGHHKGTHGPETQDFVKKAKEKKWKVPAGIKKQIDESVGVNAKNKSDDVKAVQARLKELGYPVEGIDGKCMADTIKAIRFFQSQICDIAGSIKGHRAVWLPDGVISNDQNTEKQLFAKTAPSYKPPTKSSTKKINDSVDEKRKNATGNEKTLWDKISKVWNALSPYLPADSYMTSGYRSPEGQRKILHNWYNKKYKTLIVKKYGEKTWKKYHDMQGVKDAVADPEMCKMVKGATSQLIAVPGRSAHQRGCAIDIGGKADSQQIAALLWYYAEFTSKNHVTKILPERNGCLHIEFK